VMKRSAREVMMAPSVLDWIVMKTTPTGTRMVLMTASETRKSRKRAILVRGPDRIMESHSFLGSIGPSLADDSLQMLSGRRNMILACVTGLMETGSTEKKNSVTEHSFNQIPTEHAS
jgi:hypothetical protein